MAYAKDQRLDDWVDMLHEIYGMTQNFNKSDYEIYSHLIEVTGALGKFLFKKKDLVRARSFLPKTFAWTVALVKKVKGKEASLEKIVLSKYPGSCPYCRVEPCECWMEGKPRLEPDEVLDDYHRKAPKLQRSVNDFQVMFRSIYQDSWESAGDVPARLQSVYIRLVEELAELGEATRFHHLYPQNFDNEVADTVAWWFALATLMPPEDGSIEGELPADLLWRAYPGFCPSCQLTTCDCRPEPVRELLSKPSLLSISRIDALTQANNQRAYQEDMADIAAAKYVIPGPITCARVDVDDFKSINDSYSHQTGDDALVHLATTIRQQVPYRHRFYRVGGDEFAILFQGVTTLEATGMLQRVAARLRDVPLVDNESGSQIVMTLSSGLASCDAQANILDAFKSADEASYESKNRGKDTISVQGIAPEVLAALRSS